MPDNCQTENGKNKAPSGTPAAPIKSKGLEIADLVVNVDKAQKFCHQEMMSVISGTGNNGHDNQESASVVQWIGMKNTQVQAFKDVLRNDVKNKRK